MARKMDEKETRSTAKLLKALEEFRKIDHDMPLQQVVIFLGVLAGDGEASLTSLSTKLDIAQSTASKSLSVLAGLDRRNPLEKPLIQMYENPLNRRSKVIALTPAGQLLANKIMSTIGD